MFSSQECNKFGLDFAHDISYIFFVFTYIYPDSLAIDLASSKDFPSV